MYFDFWLETDFPAISEMVLNVFFPYYVICYVTEEYVMLIFNMDIVKLIHWWTLRNIKDGPAVSYMQPRFNSHVCIMIMHLCMCVCVYFFTHVSAGMWVLQHVCAGQITSGVDFYLLRCWRQLFHCFSLGMPAYLALEVPGILLFPPPICWMSTN